MQANGDEFSAVLALSFGEDVNAHLWTLAQTKQVPQALRHTPLGDCLFRTMMEGADEISESVTYSESERSSPANSPLAFFGRGGGEQITSDQESVPLTRRDDRNEEVSMGHAVLHSRAAEDEQREDTHHEDVQAFMENMGQAQVEEEHHVEDDQQETVSHADTTTHKKRQFQASENYYNENMSAQKDEEDPSSLSDLRNRLCARRYQVAAAGLHRSREDEGEDITTNTIANNRRNLEHQDIFAPYSEPADPRVPRQKHKGLGQLGEGPGLQKAIMQESDHYHLFYAANASERIEQYNYVEEDSSHVLQPVSYHGEDVNNLKNQQSSQEQERLPFLRCALCGRQEKRQRASPEMFALPCGHCFCLEHVDYLRGHCSMRIPTTTGDGGERYTVKQDEPKELHKSRLQAQRGDCNDKYTSGHGPDHLRQGNKKKVEHHLVNSRRRATRRLRRGLTGDILSITSTRNRRSWSCDRIGHATFCLDGVVEEQEDELEAAQQPRHRSSTRTRGPSPGWEDKEDEEQGGNIMICPACGAFFSEHDEHT
ncbi:unnamed protein product [Amoebophrya sp. A25]|nr:unnamed protein product [Amoebophrya sp. A25]|eukprot:GSA25T00023983001.1